MNRAIIVTLLVISLVLLGMVFRAARVAPDNISPFYMIVMVPAFAGSLIGSAMVLMGIGVSIMDAILTRL